MSAAPKPTEFNQPAVSDINTSIPNLPRCCKATTIGLTIVGDVTYEQLRKAVEIIERHGKGYQWQLGDALLEIQERYPDFYGPLLDPAQESRRESDGQATRKQAKQIASRFPRGTRVPSLSWSHHRAAAFFDTIEERLNWLHQARDNNWSVRDLEKAIREATAEPEPPIDPDLYVLKDPAVRAYLTSDIERQRSQLKEVPENAGFLRDLQYERIEAAKWQMERTTQGDQDAVRDAVSEVMGTAYQVFLWLKVRQRIISPPDVRVYLGMLKEAGRITEQLDEKPNPTAKGTTATVYKPKRNAYDDKREEERKALAVL